MLKDNYYSKCQENLRGNKLGEDPQIRAAFKRRLAEQRRLVTSRRA